MSNIIQCQERERHRTDSNGCSVATVATAAVLVDGATCCRSSDACRSLLHRSVAHDSVSKLLLSLRETGTGCTVQAVDLRTHQPMTSSRSDYQTSQPVVSVLSRKYVAILIFNKLKITNEFQLSKISCTLCSEKKPHSHFLSYLHEWCVDLNKNCSEYT